jgi:hypothetical protein
MALAGLAAAFSPPAAALTGSVTVDWKSLQITVIDTRPDDGIVAGFQWQWQISETATFVDGTGFLPGSTSDFDWTSSNGISVVQPHFSTQAAYSADTLSVSSAASGGPTLATRVYRHGRLQFIGEGRIEATVPMQAQVAAGAGEQNAWAYADANLYFGTSDWTALSTVAYGRADLMNSGGASALLATALDFRDGEAAHLISQPGVVLQPVPEPAGWGLLTVGLAWLDLRRRRQ